MTCVTRHLERAGLFEACDRFQKMSWETYQQCQQTYCGRLGALKVFGVYTVAEDNLVPGSEFGPSFHETVDFSHIIRDQEELIRDAFGKKLPFDTVPKKSVTWFGFLVDDAREQFKATNHYLFKGKNGMMGLQEVGGTGKSSSNGTKRWSITQDSPDREHKDEDPWIFNGFSHKCKKR